MKRLILTLATFVFLISCETVKEEEQLYSTTGESSLHVTENGELVLSWIEQNESDATLKFARYLKGEFQDTTVIAKGNNWFVNWADFPAIVSNGQLWFAHYLEKSDDATFAYDVKFKLSSDNGNTWADARKLHSDTTKTEHGFVSAVPYKDGFYVTWLDGRNTGGSSHDSHDGHHGSMSLRAAFINPQGEVLNDMEVDNRTCDCCQTHISIINGRPTIVYRDRSEEEIRDVSIAQLSESGWDVSSSFSGDNWLIAGCPVNGPKILTDENGTAVAWFTGADDEGTVKLGLLNQENLTLSNTLSLETDGALGRVDLISTQEKLIITWIGKEGESYAVKLATVDWSGKVLEQKSLIDVSGSRRTGFPGIAHFNDEFFLTFTQADSGKVIFQKFSL